MVKLSTTLQGASTLLAVVVSLAIGGFLILGAGFDPLEAYKELFYGAFLDYHGLASTLVKMAPLVLAGLAVSLPLRAGLYNIGGEGQIYVGALLATAAALYLPAVPGWMGILLCSAAGMIGGGLWGLIPGYLRAARGINEVVVTILLNYVGINLVSYFVGSPMRASGAPYPYSPEVPEEFWLPTFLAGTDVHIGILIGCVLAGLLFLVFHRTSLGVSLSTVGKNEHAAHYAGISVKRHLAFSLGCGASLAGLAGAYEVLGLKHRLFHLFSAGYGYDGIVVAFLANGNPLLVIVASAFLGGLRSGANIMQRSVGVPVSLVEAIQGLVVLFVAVSLVLRLPRTKSWRLLSRNASLTRSP